MIVKSSHTFGYPSFEALVDMSWILKPPAAILQALRVMWLPVLTTVPQMEDLGAYRGHLSSLLPGLRAERGLDTADLAPQTRALCSHCR